MVDAMIKLVTPVVIETHIKIEVRSDMSEESTCLSSCFAINAEVTVDKQTRKKKSGQDRRFILM